ncbi:FAD-dependent oxidoreductase [bacterium]|nr:FAD-dependent oxidoreductase [bacterium]
MKSGFRTRQWCAALMLGLMGSAHAASLEFDIVVSGGSFSAAAAAFAAARTQPSAKILLIEPTDWLGGQATSQGVSAIDNSYHAPANTLMANNQSTYYPADYLAWLDEMRNAPAAAPGEGYAGFSGWVSRDCYDPRTGAWALDQMAADFPNITVMKLTVVKNVTTAPVSDFWGSGSAITGLTLIERTPKAGYTPFDDFVSQELPDWYSTAESSRFTKTVHTVTALTPGKELVVIDASELGDVMVLSGAKYTQGREVSTEAISDAGTLPALNDAQPMATVFPFALTTTSTVSDESDAKTPWADFDSYLAARTSDYFGLGTTSWTQVWTYRRIYRPSGGSTSSTTINVGDVSMQNWNPGNDYRQGAWLLGMAATNAQAASDWIGGANLANLALAEEHATAWYFWMKARKPGSFPASDTRLLRGSDAFNMMGTKHGLAKFPYIRCTRRIVGIDNFRITSRYFVNTQATGYVNETSYRYFDSVGIGSYTADVRPLVGSTGVAPPFSQPGPFYIPYRALASHNVRNLLASGKTMAQTYITNSAYRLHPIEWQSGSAAGTAAAFLWRDDMNNRELLDITPLREYQTSVATNAPIRWAYRGESLLPPQDGDLIVYNFQPVPRNATFEVEAYHPTATRADIYVNGGQIGTTSYRANGRLVYTGTDLLSAVSPAAFEARLYDSGGTFLTTLTTSVVVTDPVVPCEIDDTVTDNDDTDGYFTVTGSWGAGTAQTDRYCPTKPGASYTLTNSNDGARTANWRLRTTVPGNYRVAIWYSASSNRATDARFTVVHRDGSTPITINQRVSGGQWLDLGTFPFNGDINEAVILRNNHATSGAYVIADAVRVTLEEPFSSPVQGWSIF